MVKQYLDSYSLLLRAALLLTVLQPYCATAVTFNVVKLGAKADGRTDSTKAFLNAWAAACRSTAPATIYVPPGRYLLRNAVFSGCKNHDITFRIDATLVAPSDYRVISKTQSWLAFKDVIGVTIIGGILDAQGTGLWACKKSGQRCPMGATSLTFTNSNRIRVRTLTSINSQIFHIAINGCDNVKLVGVTVSASGLSPNTDGIHVQLSSLVTISNTRIKTGDDCISIGPGTTNLTIENVACGPGHGISIGSLAKEFNEEGVRNVTVKAVNFTGTDNGVRIKTWARASKAFVNHVIFQDIQMVNVQNPIIIDQNYCPYRQNCPGQVSGVKISDLRYEDIRGTSASEVAVAFNCSPKNPCSGIKLKDIKLTYKKKAARSLCVNADGTASGIIKPSNCL